MINSRDIEDLHPTVKRGAIELIRRMKEKGYDVLITSTYRDNESQTALYNQGRTTPGNIVTNAKAGQSIHNYRLAFDIAKDKKGEEFSDDTFFSTAGQIWEEMGGTWGGNFKSFVDRPHMEFKDIYTIKDFQNGIMVPQDAKMKWELSTSQNMQRHYKDKNLNTNEAINILARHKIINTPTYMLANYQRIEHLDSLIINMAKKIL